MTTWIDPAGLLRSAAEAALNGDVAAAAWLRTVAPDLAEDEGKLRAWLDQLNRDEARQFALLNAWEAEDLDHDLSLADELDNYLEAIHDQTFEYSN